MKFRTLIAAAIFLSAASAEDKEKGGLVLRQGMFSHELGMLDEERNQYAAHLSAQAANQLAADADGAAQVKSSRLLALAKTLSPRNKRAQAVSEQIRKGEKPKPVPYSFTPSALSQLLLTRGKLLVDEGGAENHWLGRAFVEVAAGLDPKNKQAVKAREDMEFDFGALDWTVLEGGK